MFEFLHKKINETIDITDEQFEYAKTLFVPKQLEKRGYCWKEEIPVSIQLLWEKVCCGVLP